MSEFNIYDNSGNHIGTARESSGGDGAPMSKLSASIFGGLLITFGFIFVEAVIDLLIGNFIARTFPKSIIIGHWIVAYIIIVIYNYTKK